MKFWTIKGLHHQIAKIKGLYILSVWQRLNSFMRHYWYGFVTSHSCMPSPLAPDPIRVQPCVWCLLWTNRNSLAVTSIFLSISLSNQSYESLNRRYQLIEIFTSTETIVIDQNTYQWCKFYFLLLSNQKKSYKFIFLGINK